MQVAKKHHSGRNRPVGPPPWLFPLILLLLTAGFYWKLLLTNQYTWLDGYDMTNQVWPWFQVQAEEWHRGRFPLWDPYQWGGQPLLGQVQPGVAYPLNWILFSLPRTNGWIRIPYLHWYFVLIHYMAVLFAYWLLRDLKRSPHASVLGGVLFGFGGYFSSIDWPQMLNGALWTPLVFLFTLRALRGRRWISSAAAAGGALGMAWLSGHHQAPTFVTWTLLICLATASFRNARIRWRVPAVAIILFICSILLSALQILPGWEYGKLAKRWVGAPNPIGWREPVPYSVHNEYSLNPLSILGLPIIDLNQHTTLYIGLVGTALVIFSVWYALRYRAMTPPWFLLSGAIGLALALGGLSWLHGIAYSLFPLIEKSRSPNAAVLLVHLSLCVLIACGFDAYFKTEPNRRAWLARWLLTFGGLFAGILLLYIFNGKGDFPDRLVLVFADAILLGVIFLFAGEGRMRRPFVFVALLLIAMNEVSMSATYMLPNRYDQKRKHVLEKPREAFEIIAFLRSHAGLFRVEVSDEERIPFNLGALFGIDSIGGYLASVSANLLDQDLWSDRARDLWGVRYTIGKAPATVGMREIFDGGVNGIKVYERPGAFPRAWFGRSVVGIASAPGMDAFLQNPANDLRIVTPVEGAVPKTESCDGSDFVSVTERWSSHVLLTVETPCARILTLAETYFPGWTGRVDGSEVPVVETYGAFRGLVVPAGRHRVEFVYAPNSIRVGAGLSLLGLFLVAGLLLVPVKGRLQIRWQPMKWLWYHLKLTD